MHADFSGSKTCLIMRQSLQKESFLFLFFLIPVLFIAGSCGSKKETSTSRQTTAPVYQVLTLSPRSTTLHTDFPATIQGQQNIEIRPKVDGYIDAIYVDEGATVRRGQPLFRISAPQFEQEVRTAQADIQIAAANVNAAQMQVSKVRPLVEKNILSRYELESAQYTLQARQAALAQAQARLANARTNLGYTSVTSPVNGVVGTIPYRVGSLVNSGTEQPLTTVANVGNIYAYFSIPEKVSLAFNRNTAGATTEKRLATLPPVTLLLADGTEFPQKGKVETASGLINTQTGSVSVRATFPNPGNIIRSGSTGTIRIPRTLDAALLIPQSATFELQGKTLVYLLQPDSTVTSREVTVLPGNSGQFFVVQEGLKAGDQIVAAGVGSLQEGMFVQPQRMNADSLFATPTAFQP